MSLDPITREEMYLAAAAGYDVTPPEPVTRKEIFLAQLAGMEVETPVPFTRRERFLEAAAVAANRAVIEPLDITKNGTYTAPEGVDGYNPVVVNVAGSSADLRYVTFMSYDDLVEYGKKAVAVGDDCADPIARGVFAKPTRESDAQYTYTHYGWANEPNGAADPNWNKAVTEDKTVYANFTSTVRYYTITYYDSDGTTVLKTESLAYGAMPSYKPVKDGSSFDSWIPAVSSVTGEMSYTAKWTEKLTFSGATWADIARVAEAGEAPSHFKVGDTKEVELTYTDGSKETITVAVADFASDDLNDGSGKAGMTIVCMTVPTKKAKWSSNTTGVYYNSCGINSLLTNTILPSLPTELQNVIKSVTKKYDNTHVQNATTYASAGFKLWALSFDELGCTTSTNDYGSNRYARIGKRYSLFPVVNDVNGSSFPKVTVPDGTANAYHTRQLYHYSNSTIYSLAILASGNMSYNARDTSYCVRFGFCI